MTDIPDEITRIYYTLRRQSDGAWLTMNSYPHITVCRKPKMLAQYATASKQRILAMLAINAHHGDIDIHKIIQKIQVTPTPHSSGVAFSTKRLAEVFHYFSLRDKWTVGELCQILAGAEDLFADPKCMDMRYYAYLQINKLKYNLFQQTKDELKTMKSIANFKSKKSMHFCIATDMDLTKMVIAGFKPDFIYDFETKAEIKI
jgi:isopentenyldiphosphate isomerase